MKLFFYIMAVSIIFAGCGTKEDTGPESNNTSGNYTEPKYEINSVGIGPVEKVELGSIDNNLVQQGEQIFNSKCIACHTLEEKRLGPALGNVTKKLRPEFIMNYLLNTNEMQEKDEYLKSLVKEYNIIMPDQNLNETEARSVLEFLRSAPQNQ